LALTWQRAEPHPFTPVADETRKAGPKSQEELVAGVADQLRDIG